MGRVKWYSMSWLGMHAARHVAPAVQLLYCFVWGLVYVDQGLLSSNGVTGTRSSDPSNTAVGADDQGGLEARLTFTWTRWAWHPCHLSWDMRGMTCMSAPVAAMAVTLWPPDPSKADGTKHAQCIRDDVV